MQHRCVHELHLRRRRASADREAPEGQGSLNRLARQPQITHVWDWLDDETSTTDVRGKVWLRGYDALRRPIRLQSPSGLVRETEYRLWTSGLGYQNRVTTWTPPGHTGGVATVTGLNVLGQRVSQQTGSLTAASYTYDAVGHLQQVIDPASVRTHYDYDGFGQVTTKIDFYLVTPVTTTYSYDAAGNLASLDGPRTDANDSLSYAYDLAGRLLTATQNGLILPGSSNTPVTTTYLWDDAGERVRVTQPMSTTQSLVRDWTFDPRSTAKTSTYADAKGTTTNHYSPQGWLESVNDPRAITLNFEYDNQGRRTRRYGVAGSTKDNQTFTYDFAANMLTAKVTSTRTTITMDYDNDGRISHVYQASTQPTTTYTYAPSTGRLSSVVDPAGTTSYDYNSNGELWHLTDPFNTTAAVSYSYDSAGRVYQRTDPAGPTWSRSYEWNTGRLDTQSVVNYASGQTLGSFDLGYDAASNVTSRAETVKTETGAITRRLGHLGIHLRRREPDGDLHRTFDDPATSYGYDGAGDRTSVKVGNGSSPHHGLRPGRDFPLSSSDRTVYTHDALGELTKIDRTGGTTNDWNYTYDTWGGIKKAARTPPARISPTRWTLWSGC